YQVAEQLSRDPEQALKIHSQEELGVDPHSLPSPRVAAVSSFVSFALGALVPLLPYLFGASSLWPALVLSLLGLFVTGAVVSRVTARGWLYSGTRQLLLGAAAAGLTYLIGSVVGAGLT
ncbi:MAG TPA: VIT1/CCC1 transporter family protein, partial [Actinomycetes bacterium]|nr:VIT1/CCC1 transporter family protein [Actinomycetes bacterium]